MNRNGLSMSLKLGTILCSRHSRMDGRSVRLHLNSRNALIPQHRTLCVSANCKTRLESCWNDHTDRNYSNYFNFQAAFDYEEGTDSKHPNRRVRISYCVTSSGDTRKISTLFHAPWLWCNDPSYIHASSGQRTRSVVSYYSNHAKLHSVQIIFSKSHTEIVNKDNDELCSPVQPIPPPPGSVHPIGGIYDLPGSIENTSRNVPREQNQELLHVVWQTTSGFIQSYYDISWLVRCRYDDLATHESYRKSEFNTLHVAESISSKEVSFRAFQYSDLFLQEDTRRDESAHVSTYHCFQLLDAIFQDGAAVIKNVPNPYRGVGENTDIHDDDLPAAMVGKILSGGQLSHGKLYGNVFHVQDREAADSSEKKDHDSPSPEANNIAYTSMALCPHQDLAYYESIPGLQLLHCVANDPDSIVGGESTLIDVVAAAEHFRELEPELFGILVKCEATFVKQRNDVDMIYRRPHILLAPSSGAITSVRWSPPFEGPLFLPPSITDEYYLAYAVFERMLDNSLPRYSSFPLGDNSGTNQQLIPQISSELESKLCDYAHDFTWEHRLKPREMLVFNNQRMLHGRRSYSIVAAASKDKCTWGRHLIGCYTNIDDTLNQYRILRRIVFRDWYRLPKERNSGNGSSHVL